jgi:hypothetical protein
MKLMGFSKKKLLQQPPKPLIVLISPLNPLYFVARNKGSLIPLYYSFQNERLRITNIVYLKCYHGQIKSVFRSMFRGLLEELRKIDFNIFPDDPETSFLGFNFEEKKPLQSIFRVHFWIQPTRVFFHRILKPACGMITFQFKIDLR